MKKIQKSYPRESNFSCTPQATHRRRTDWSDTANGTQDVVGMPSSSPRYHLPKTQRRWVEPTNTEVLVRVVEHLLCVLRADPYDSGAGRRVQRGGACTPVPAVSLAGVVAELDPPDSGTCCTSCSSCSHPSKSNKRTDANQTQQGTKCYITKQIDAKSH